MSEAKPPKMPRGSISIADGEDEIYSEACLEVWYTDVNEYTKAIRACLSEMQEYIDCLRYKGYIIEGITLDKSIKAVKTEKVKIL